MRVSCIPLYRELSVLGSIAMQVLLDLAWDDILVNPPISWISSVENTFKTASIILRLLNTNFSSVDQHYGLLGGWDAVD